MEYCDYHDDAETMVIKFANGGTYHYPECSKAQYEALKSAASPGAHFHQHIRKLRSKKVT